MATATALRPYAVRERPRSLARPHVRSGAPALTEGGAMRQWVGEGGRKRGGYLSQLIIERESQEPTAVR